MSDLTTTSLGNAFAIDDILLTEGQRTPAKSRETIDCSCDPYDKSVSPIGCGTNGNISKNQNLNYIIYFKNTGFGPAHKIIISDRLDTHLNLNTFKFLSGSYPITKIQIIPNRNLVIEFDSIELASDSMASVTFSISPDTGLANGTQITNQAAIYFDSNNVVLTSVTINTVYDYPEPDIKFTSKHNCSNSGLAYDFEYTGITSDSAHFFGKFTDGTPSTSSNQNPSNVVFSSTGYKQIILTITRNGCEESLVDSILINNEIHSGDSIFVCLGSETEYIPLSSLDTYLSNGFCIGACINPSNLSSV